MLLGVGIRVGIRVILLLGVGVGVGVSFAFLLLGSLFVQAFEDGWFRFWHRFWFSLELDVGLVDLDDPVGGQFKVHLDALGIVVLVTYKRIGYFGQVVRGDVGLLKLALLLFVQEADVAVLQVKRDVAGNVLEPENLLLRQQVQLVEELDRRKLGLALVANRLVVRELDREDRGVSDAKLLQPERLRKLCCVVRCPEHRRFVAVDGHAELVDAHVILQRLLHFWDPLASAKDDDLLNVVFGHVGHLERVVDGRGDTPKQRRGHLFKLFPADGRSEVNLLKETFDPCLRFLVGRKHLLRLLRRVKQLGHGPRRPLHVHRRLHLWVFQEFLQQVVSEDKVKLHPSHGPVVADAHDLELRVGGLGLLVLHRLVLHDGGDGGLRAHVVEQDVLRRFVELFGAEDAVVHRNRGGRVQQLQHFHVCQLRDEQQRLPLRLGEVRRHGEDHARDVLLGSVGSALDAKLDNLREQFFHGVLVFADHKDDGAPGFVCYNRVFREPACVLGHNVRPYPLSQELEHVTERKVWELCCGDHCVGGERSFAIAEADEGVGLTLGRIVEDNVHRHARLRDGSKRAGYGGVEVEVRLKNTLDSGVQSAQRC